MQQYLAVLVRCPDDLTNTVPNACAYQQSQVQLFHSHSATNRIANILADSSTLTGTKVRAPSFWGLCSAHYVHGRVPGGGNGAWLAENICSRR